ncbi:signal transduction protein with Nacht domain protein [Candidatus Magnetobacterium bavaricum]|uniref:Signal transduction protein with Nacht domain protein n=1 Tax=Candidatus Magnetobacterium bavaricum TaxID=29290 RepID=A0A0F3H0Z2_9BACT|nr:signal transduction protein with Nacht domain protein [Candidatus Magnetobacterium bavaricum]
MKWAILFKPISDFTGIPYDLVSGILVGLLGAFGWIFKVIWKKIKSRIEKPTGDKQDSRVVTAINEKIDNAVQKGDSFLARKISSASQEFEERYRKSIIDVHNTFNTKGLGLIASNAIDLDQVFVDVRIDLSSNPNKPLTNLIETRELAETKHIWDFIRFSEEGRKKNQRVECYALIGPPGCGKTTLLQNIAVILADKRHEKYNIRPYVPIFITIRQVAKDIVKEPEGLSLGDLAKGYFSNEGLFPKLKPLDTWFEDKLKKGDCIVLLDGLDEVGDQGDRRKVSDWVNSQIKKYPGSLFLLTSRPLGYKAAPLEDAYVLEVQNFNVGQVKSFINNWYLANEKRNEGDVDNYKVRERAACGAANLLQHLQEVPALNALTANPLLLRMITMFHKYSEGKLPDSRFDLYENICKLMLDGWSQNKGLDDKYEYDKKKDILEQLAIHMMKVGKENEISRENAIKFTKKSLSNMSVKKGEEVVFFLDLQESSGLLVEQKTEILSFFHLTFKEFLAASYWLRKNNSKRDWCNYINNESWHGTLKFYAARRGVTDIIKTCLEVKTIPSLTLALECLEEVQQIDNEIREAAERFFAHSVESPDEDMRKIALEAIMNKQLKLFNPIDNNLKISRDYVICAQYQLFIDDTRKNGDYLQPDHWLGYKFPAGRANEPIVGVRLDDAEKFCKWLTEKQGGTVLYRLPTSQEAKNYVTKSDKIAMWCGEKGNEGLFGLTEEIKKNLDETLHERLNSIFQQSTDIDVVNILDLARACVRALDNALALALDLDLAFVFDLAFALACDRDFACDRTIARTLVCDRALVCAHAHARDLTITRARARVRNFALALARARELDFACVLVLASIPDSENINTKNISDDIVIKHYKTALKKIEPLLSGDHNEYIKRRAALLKDVLHIAISDTAEERIISYRKYMARIFEYICIGFDDMGTKERDAYKDGKQAALHLYLWSQLTLARIEGKLPAWEGIRLVREQVT